MSLLFNMLSRLVITFLPWSKRLVISWLQSPSAVIWEPQKIKSDTVSTVSPYISHEVIGPEAMIFDFWMLSFKPAFSLSSICHWSEVKWSDPVVSDSLWPHGLQPTRLLSPWNFPGKSTGVGCQFLLKGISQPRDWTQVSHIAGRHFTFWATREALFEHRCIILPYYLCFSQSLLQVKIWSL